MCNGQPDCEDESDEIHCKCALPSTYFDCSSFDHTRQPLVENTTLNCILRSLLCDGRSQCQNDADEKEICNENSIQRNNSWSDNNLSLLFIIGCFFVLLIFVICLCACYAYRRCQNTRYGKARRDSDHSAELSVHFRRFRPSTAQTIVVSSAANPGSSLFPHQSLVEVALQEFPIYESATLPHKHAYNSLPWTSNRIRNNYQLQNNSVLYDGAGEAMVSSSNAGTSSFFLPAPNQMYGHNFRVPPPSAISSTYGIPKPGLTSIKIEFYYHLVGPRYHPVPLLPRHARYISTTSSSSINSESQRQNIRRPRKKRRRLRRSDDQNTLREKSMPPPYTDKSQ